jgi:hypothetical protein
MSHCSGDLSLRAKCRSPKEQLEYGMALPSNYFGSRKRHLKARHSHRHAAQWMRLAVTSSHELAVSTFEGRHWLATLTRKRNHNKAVAVAEQAAASRETELGRDHQRGVQVFDSQIEAPSMSDKEGLNNIKPGCRSSGLCFSAFPLPLSFTCSLNLKFTVGENGPFMFIHSGRVTNEVAMSS